MIIIPENELDISFSRSGGKGGQNVNKVETKATLRWDVYNSQVLTPEEKYKIVHKLHNRITEKGDLVLWSQSQRSQAQNKAAVIAKLNDLINRALQPEKKRIPTRPSKASKEKRIQAKKRKSEKKQLRRKIEF